MKSSGMSQAATTSQAESERFTPSKEPFYKKPCIVGGFRFWQKNAVNRDVPFIKINWIKEEINICEKVAERVLNMLPELHKIKLVLSISDGVVNNAYDRDNFVRGLKSKMPGTCLFTSGIERDIYTLQDLKNIPHDEKCLAIGFVKLDRENSSPRLHVIIPTKDYGFDTDGDMFVLDSSGERWTLDPAVLTENSNPKMLSNAPPCKTSNTFKEDDLVLICNDSDEFKILQGDIWIDEMAVASGKIGSIRDIIDNQLIITLPMKVSMTWFVCKPEAVTLLNYERMTDLLEKHFEKHEPANMCGELVQAVKEKMSKEVINLLRTAIKVDSNRRDWQDVYTQKRGTEGDVENDTYLDPDHDIFVIFEKDNESEMKFRVQLETAIVSVISERLMVGSTTAQHIPIVKLSLPRNQNTEERSYGSIPNLSVSTTGSKFEDSKNVPMKESMWEEITTFVVGHCWKEKIMSQAEMAKLVQEMCEDDNHKNLSSVVTKAVMNGRCDFFEQLFDIDGNFLKNFRLAANDRSVLRKKVNDSLQRLTMDSNNISQILSVIDISRMHGQNRFWRSRDNKATLNPNAICVNVLTFWNVMFLWAILLRQHDCAILLWKKVENPVAMALIAYSVCKDLRRITDDKVQASHYKKRKNDWSSLANETFCQCFERDADTTLSLLLIELPYWKDESCLEIAIHSGNKAFITHPTCQNVLDIFWNRGINENVTNPKPEDSRCIWVFKLLCCFTIVAPIVSLFCPCCGKAISFLNVPKNKFIYNLISFAVFLTMFAYVLLFDLATNVSTLEYVLLAWVLTVLAEEIRQMASDISTYFKNAWNVLDVGTIVGFIVGFGLRFKQFPESFDAPKVVLAVDFVAFVFRLTHVFSIHRVLGPKLLMVRRMVKDLMYFLIILAVFVVSYAIASHSVLYPVSPPTWDTVRQVLRRPYWHLYGELFLDETEGQSTCSDNATIWTAKDMPRCPSETGKIVVPIMMGFYMLFVNILLLNLLIAIFSHSIAKIQVQSENHWVYQRYFLIKEYVSRHVYYPPLNVIWMVITIIRCCVEKRNVFKDNSRHFCEYLNFRASQIKKLQASAVKACDESRKDNVDAKIKATHEMLHQMSGRINLVEAKIIDEIHEMEKRMNVFETKILEELKKLRKQNRKSNMTRGVKADV